MRTVPPALAFVLPPLFAALACQDAGPPPSAHADRGPVEAQAEAALLAPSPPATPAPDAPGFEFASVDWAAFDASPRLAPDALPPGALRPDEVPVLLPAGLPLAAATLSRGPGWYTASIPLEGHHVVVHGTRLRFGGASREPDRPPRTSRMDGIVEADLTRFGAAYTLAVECAAPSTDARCADDEYVAGLVASLRALPRGAR